MIAAGNGFAGKEFTISHLPDAAERWIQAPANCEMLFYNVGGASICRPRQFATD